MKPQTTLVPGVAWPKRVTCKSNRSRIPHGGATSIVIAHLSKATCPESEKDISDATGVDAKNIPKMAFRGYLNRVKAPSKLTSKTIWYYTLKEAS